jgi:hypothetical protein
VPDIIALGSNDPQAVIRNYDPPIVYHQDLEDATKHTLLEQYLSGVVILHPYTLSALVRRIAVAFCMPRHEWSNLSTEVPMHLPMLLVRLLCLPSSQKDLRLKHAIGVALTTCALTFVDYPGWTPCDQSRRSRALEALAYHFPIKNVFQPVTAESLHRQTPGQSLQSHRDSRAAETSSLLRFGLIGLLEHPSFHLLTDNDLAVFNKTYKQIDQNHSRDSKRIHSVDENFSYQKQVNRAIASCLREGQLRGAFSSSVRARLECLNAVDSYCIRFNHDDDDFGYLPLLTLFCRNTSSEEQGLCSTMLLRGRYGPRNVSRDLIISLRDQGVLEMLSTASHSKNERIAPLAMRYLWHLVDIILSSLPSRSSRSCVAISRDEAESVLRPLLESDLTTFPKTVVEMGLYESWISDLEEMASKAPWLILESKIIPCLAGMLHDFRAFLSWLDSTEPPSLQDGETDMKIRLWNLNKACMRELLVGNTLKDSSESQS